jgi:hypothetical protein
MTKDWNSSGRSSTDWLWGTLKQSPESLLLLAAGCALLLRRGQSIGRTESYRSDAEEYLGDGQSVADDMPHQSTIGDWANEASRLAGNAREHAASVGKKLGETAADYTASVNEYAHDTRESVVGQSKRLAQKAQSKLRTLIQEQPVAVALAGLAAGVALAAALPVTTPERRVLGPARHRLSETAESLGEKISEAGVAAGEGLIRRVAEHAVRAGLKEVAGEPERAGEQRQNSPLNADAPGSSANKSGTDQLTSDSQREGEESSEVAKAAKAVLDAQQKAVDDIRAGRPAPYYFTAPALSVSGGTTASGPNEPDAEKK